MTQNSLTVGAHMSIAKGFVAALHRSRQTYSANAMQVFLKSPRGRGVTKLTDSEAAEFRKQAKEDPFYTVAHASYLINLAKPLSLEDPWPLNSLVADLRSMSKLEGAGVVLHIGKTLKLPYEEAQAHLVENLKRALDETSDLDQHIILENTAGQGTEMGYTFEQLQALDEALGKPKRISFCLDTCHAFAGGYDLSTAAGAEAAWEEFDRTVGLKRLSLIHFNDSLKELGSRRDRHQNLDEGFIGREGLEWMARWAKSHRVPLILETPEKTRTHLDDLERLRSWF